MPVQAQCPDDHPLMVAWNSYKQTEAFENSKRWAIRPEHTDGSLWAAFSAGFNAQPAPGAKTPATPTLAEGTPLWLWREGDHFLAFAHEYPCFKPAGDPMTLGEPAGTAVFKASHARTEDVALEAQGEAVGLTGKEAWWAGVRVGLGVASDMPRVEVAALLDERRRAAPVRLPPFPCDQRHVAVAIEGQWLGWVFVRHSDGENWTSAAKLTDATLSMLQRHVARDHGQLVGEVRRG